MQYNWMSVPVEVSCVASKVTVAQRKDSDSLLNGLRAFRDHGLKPMQTGRRLIQSYYSHSPEMAMLLIRDSKARAAAMEIIEHFSELGHAFNNHASLEQMLDANAAVLPEHVESAIQQVLALIDEKGSPELRREVEPLSETIRSFRGLSLAQAFDVVNTMAPAEKGGAMNVVHPQKLAPASRKADWELIREYMAPVKDTRELPGSIDTRQRSWQRME